MLFGDRFGGKFGALGDPVNADAEAPVVLLVEPLSPSAIVGIVAHVGEAVVLLAQPISPSAELHVFTGTVLARLATGDVAKARLATGDVAKARLGVTS